MMSKGSRRRPASVSHIEMEQSWQRIFGRKEEDLTVESDNPLEGGMLWKHYCAINGTHLVGKGEHCNWCGENEQGDLDYEIKKGN